jgi:hypothetical protein
MVGGPEPGRVYEREAVDGRLGHGDVKVLDDKEQFARL